MTTFYKLTGAALLGLHSRQKNVTEFKYRLSVPWLLNLCFPHCMQLLNSPDPPMPWNGEPFSLAV